MVVVTSTVDIRIAVTTITIRTRTTTTETEGIHGTEIENVTGTMIVIGPTEVKAVVPIDGVSDRVEPVSKIQ